MKLSATERDTYTRDGWLLRRSVYAEPELEVLRDASEAVVAEVTAAADREESGRAFRLDNGQRFQFGRGSLIQWEWREGSREVRLLEPFSQLHPRFAALWDDARLSEPAAGLLEVAAAGPFTCKLNLKRPLEGSEFPWHQDYTYWYARTPEHAHEIVNAMLFLDAASEANGAMRVLPGSHHAGPAPRDRQEASQFLADPAQIETSREVLVEAPAGSVLFFPALLLHRSAPNLSRLPRRAVLLSFQPAGRPRQELLPWRPERVHELP